MPVLKGRWAERVWRDGQDPRFRNDADAAAVSQCFRGGGSGGEGLEANDVVKAFGQSKQDLDLATRLEAGAVRPDRDEKVKAVSI